MKITILTFCVGIICFSVMNAQTLDSLYEQYHNLDTLHYNNIKNKAKVLGQIADKEINRNPELALKLQDSVALLAQKIGDQEKAIFHKYYVKGVIYARQKEYVKALEYYKKYATVFKKEGVDAGFFLVDVGNIYFGLGLYGIAQQYYQEAETVFQLATQGPTSKIAYSGLGTIYGNYALIAEKQAKLDSAYLYSHKALEIQELYVKDSFQLAHMQWSLSELLFQQEKYKTALPFVESSVQLLESSNLKSKQQYEQFSYLLPYGNITIAKIHLASGEEVEAQKYIEFAIEAAKKIEQQQVYMRVISDAGELFIEISDYERAYKLLTEAVVLAEEKLNYEVLQTTYSHLKKLNRQQKNYRAALYYAEKYQILKDSLLNRQDQLLNINNLILQQEQNFKIKEQAQKIALEQKKQRQLYSFIGLISLGAILLFVFLLNIRKKNRTIKEYSATIAKSNQEKELLLAALGHDLRTPFNIIINSASQIETNLSEREDKELSQAMQHLLKAARNGYSMMDGLMQWVNFQQYGTDKSLRQNVQLKKLAKLTVEELGEMAKMYDIHFSIEMEEHGSIFIERDFVQIILRNLLTNAMKYGNSATTVSIIGIQKEQQYELGIHDEGLGFPKALLQKLGTTAEDYIQASKKGGGLGLLLVKELCKRIGISILFKNHAQGASVTLEIPLTEAGGAIAEFKVDQEELLSETYSSTELAVLKSYLERLADYEVFEATSIYLIVEEMEENINWGQHPKLVSWMKNFKQALQENDEAAYYQLLRLGR